MKFSKKKKAKIRKRNQRRINHVCSDMTGCCIDYEHGYIVKDQAKIKGIMYLLVQVEDNQCAIYKIVKVGEYVRLSAKKILYNQKAFSNHVYWKNHSTIQFSENGKIKFVKRTVRKLTWKNNKPIIIYIIEG